MEATQATQRLEEALELAESGRKQEAQKCFRALVAEGARLPKASMALGVLCGERGDKKQRRVWLLHARQLELEGGGPCSVRLLLNLLVDAFEAGDGDGALAYGREALEHYPENGEVCLALARVYLEEGNQEEAQLFLEQAVKGIMSRVSDNPSDVKAWRLLASCELNAGRIDAAIEAYLHALMIDPNHLPTLQSIGGLLINRGQIDSAMPWLMNALAIAPQNPDVLTLNAAALKMLGELEQAIPLLQKALIADPTHKEACLLLGDCICTQGLFMKAADVFRAGLAGSPSNLDLKSGLAACLRSMGEGDAALKIYRELFDEEPGIQGIFNNLMFMYSISDQVSPKEALTVAYSFWARKGITTPSSYRLDNVSPIHGRPIKVGILSADIGSHVVGMFLDSLLRHNDSSKCHLELISMKRRYESSSEVLIGMVEKAHSLEGLPIKEAQEYLKREEYDLIVDTSGYTYGSGLHILAERCAPVQAHYIGYHATTGLPTVDWFIGDEETAAHELQEQFTERLWRLPRTWLSYPATYTFPEAASLVDTVHPVFGCFCQLGKITDTTLQFWGEIFRRVPKAHLVLKDKGLQDPMVRDQLEQKLGKHGITSDRIHFFPPTPNWSDHCEFYNLLDIALDTTPWSSATTGFEALGMGVPLAAIRGSRTVSRMSSSLVKGMGYPEWAGETPGEVADVVCTLCASIDELRDRKRKLQLKFLNSELSDGDGMSKALILAFRRMVSIAQESI